ncbi:OB-fold nucleic acid binding domain-containing protein [Haloarcula salinisoli]|uniref:OB-fold nucleic acid binding domain-containing protein n=1 Tax=Haloarcula salinisoli TaxID=2487746 RepID=A0A8J7YKI1_9EURY|nr:OB-fold nucleic acid binding domain-containing protein [Halomicroarcula salinisoli]MBX0285036.1 OB-fold nucleic acid binding domain-containing protein [Halomicroarcula salinisoli]MBX0303486.1 OB-fold nucleic acid binding domain-containing protein [Halomicroarcula salinisoli]
MVQNAGVRTYGLVAVALMVGLAGCGGILGGGGGCGPGETEIAEASGEVSVTGEVTETGQGSFTIDDGTDTAFVQSTDDVSEGDCVTVEGVASDTSSMPGANVTIAAESISVN